MDAILDSFDGKETQKQEGLISLRIGRPNVGKSSLVNAI